MGVSQFPDPKQAQLGAQFGIQTDQGVHMATVTAVVGDQVTLDLNHLLAGDFVASIKGRDHAPYLTFFDGWRYQVAIDAIRAGQGWQELPQR